MPQRRYGEMRREYGIWIDKQFKMLVYYLLYLFLGAVGLAQEARSLGYRLLVNAGTRATADTCDGRRPTSPPAG